MQTHYNTLGVSPTAEDVVIRAAYRAMSQRYHPDLNAGDEEAEARMVSINAAYAILSNSNSRATYDAFLADLGRPGPSQYDAQSSESPVTPRPPGDGSNSVKATRNKPFLKVFASMLLVAIGLLALSESTFPQKNHVRELAERGDIPSQIAMGRNSLWPQDGHKKDIDKGIEWLQKAGLQGDAEAQYVLGDFYTFSMGGRHDEKKGKAWLLKAAEQGHVQAQIKLGVQYLYGRPPDHEAAIVWLERAAVSGSKNAQMTLGIAYDTGNIETDNLIKSYAWSWLSSDYKFWELDRPNAGVREHGMKELGKRMTGDEVAEAMKMVAQLRK